jgi:hypothetical protein
MYFDPHLVLPVMVLAEPAVEAFGVLEGTHFAGIDFDLRHKPSCSREWIGSAHSKASIWRGTLQHDRWGQRLIAALEMTLSLPPPSPLSQT